VVLADREARNMRTHEADEGDDAGKRNGDRGQDADTEQHPFPEPSGGEVIRGKLYQFDGHSGLRVHATDAMELHDLTTRVDIDPGLTVGIFLQGELRVGIDGAEFGLGHPVHPTGHMWVVNRPSTLERRSNKGRHIRKVLFSVPLEWLAAAMEAETATAGSLEQFLATHLAAFSWRPSRRAVALAEQIINPGDGPKVLRNMAVESRAIDILGEALSAFMGIGTADNSRARSMRQASRAERIRDHILTNVDDELRLDTIAREIGMSVGSMQRAFKSAFGTTIAEFTREARLYRARDAMDSEGISVSEAAYRAGYSSPANFSTAFKKLFGLTPSQARK
jgi:AraC-like DNA-binding protein